MKVEIIISFNVIDLGAARLLG